MFLIQVARALRRQVGPSILYVVLFVVGGAGLTGAAVALDQVAVRPLSAVRPHDLVVFGAGLEQGVSRSAMLQTDLFSFPHFVFMRGLNTALSELAAVSSFDVSIPSTADRPDWIANGPALARLVSGNYFRLFGVPPAAGRSIGFEDESRSAAVAVLSYQYARRACTCAVRDLLGTEIRSSVGVLQVVGVMPETFSSESIGRVPDIYLPITLEPKVAGDDSALGKADVYWLYLIGRKRDPGTSPQAIAQQMEPVLETYASGTNRISPADLAPFQMLVRDGSRGLSSAADNAKRGVLQVLIAQFLLAAGVAAALASLGLLSLENRRRDLVAQYALGASPLRLAALAVGEVAVLSAGGILAVLALHRPTLTLVGSLATTAVSLLLPLVPSVRSYTISLLSGLLLACIPVAVVAIVHRTRKALLAVSSRTADSSRSWISWVLASHVAVASLIVLMASGIAGDVLRLWRTPLGIQSAGLALARIDWRDVRASQAEQAALVEGALSAILSIDNVERAAAARSVILVRGFSTQSVEVVGRERGEEAMEPIVEFVAPAYFGTLGIPVIEGRDMTSSVSTLLPEEAVVNQAFVEQYFPNGRLVLGASVSLASAGSKTIVSVVGNVRQGGVRDSFRPIVYLSGVGRSLVALVVRFRGDRDVNTDAIVAAGGASGIKFQWVRGLDEHLRRTIGPDLIVAELASAIALACIVVAAVSTYSFSRYVNSRRNSDIAIRLALGATARHIALLGAGFAGRILWRSGCIIAPMLLAAYALSRSVPAVALPAGVSSALIALAGVVSFVATCALAALSHYRRFDVWRRLSG